MILRQNYTAIKKKYNEIGKKNVRLTQSTIILIQDISAARDSYKFPILESDQSGTAKPEEIRLNINDEFIANEIGFYLGAEVTVEGTTLKSKRLLTYAPVELNSDYMKTENAYTGQLQILVNKINFVEKWDLKKHNYIPRTQFQNSSVGIPSATQPSINFAEHGMFPLQPNITFSGAKKNDIIMTLPEAVAPSSSLFITPNAPTEQTVAIKQFWFVFRGLLGQNASAFQD